jgi:hypothetical protein
MTRSDLRGRIGRRFFGGAATIVGTALALAVTAGGAWGASFTITGAEGPSAPSVAIGANGTAYVAYEEFGQIDGTTDIAVCTLPSKATQCAHLAVLAQPTSEPGGPESPDVGVDEPMSIFVNAAGEPVVLVQGQSQNDNEVGPPAPELVYASTDGGASFTTSSTYAQISPTSWGITGAVGNLAFTSSAFAPSIGDGVAFGATEVGNGVGPTRLDLNGVAVGAPGSGYAQLRILPASLASNLTSAVADTASGISILHAWSGASPMKYRSDHNSTGYAYYSGPGLQGASPAQVVADADSASNYTVGVVFDDVSWASLAGGPQGTFLFENPLPTRSAPNEVTVRKWSSDNAFGSARAIDCGRGTGYETASDVDASEDPGTGDLHAVFDEYAKHVWSVLYVELTRSGQSSPTVLASFKGAILPGPSGTAVASTDSHPGLVVWRHGGVKGDPVVGSWLPAVSTSGCAATRR